MLRDGKYRADYVAFINNMLEKGYAMKIPDARLKCEKRGVWYLPHHGVYNRRKPDKIRSIRVKTQLSELSRPIHKVVLLLPVDEQLLMLLDAS